MQELLSLVLFPMADPKTTAFASTISTIIEEYIGAVAYPSRGFSVKRFRKVEGDISTTGPWGSSLIASLYN